MSSKILLLMFLLFGLAACDEGKAISAEQVETPKFLTQESLLQLDQRLSAQGLKKGDEIFMRIFKKEGVLELWMRPYGKEQFVHFHTYPICYFSGTLGPKQKEGDRQAPEGFYAIGLQHLHPGTNYHLAFNLGYPNKYDQAMGYTGDFIMVHGGCASAGCYAMTDVQVEEIYTLAEAALKNGQSFFRVHVFPFHLTKQNLAQYENSVWLDFWKMLKPGYDAFEATHLPPDIEVINKRYQVCNKAKGC